jgi:hypothetical protein
MAANQHHPTRVTCITLKRTHINTPPLEKLEECSPDGIFTKSTNEANGCAKPSESTGHVGGCTTQAVITRIGRSSSGIPSKRAKPIHQSLTQAQHARSQRRQIGHDSKSDASRLATAKRDANQRAPFRRRGPTTQQ